jgi:polysaccharide biosynthesis/export protein PslD
MNLPRTGSTLPKLLGVLVLLSLAPACASAGEPMSKIASEVNATLEPHPGRFLPGDSVEVRFKNNKDMDHTVQVDMEGWASFVVVGRIRVLGKSPEEVEQILEEAYQQKLASPDDLAVNLVGLNPDTDLASTNRPIHVLGEVRNPGSFPYLGNKITLIEALARAGSFDKRSALLKQVLLVRWMPKDNTYRYWKIDARPDQWTGPEQIHLQAYDVLFVPQKPIDKVDIWVDQYIRQLIPFPYLIPPTY